MCKLTHCDDHFIHFETDLCLNFYSPVGQSRPQSPRPLDQRSGSARALAESKTGTRKSWFRFDSARVSEIVVEINRFQQPMRFSRLFGGLSV